MKLHVLVVAVTACGGGSKGPTTNTGVGIGGKAIYQSMFTKGASWSFTGETKTTPPVDMGPPTSVKHEITCTVSDTHEMPSKSGPVSMATVTCAEGAEANPTGGNPPAGIYAANSSGLYYFLPSDPKAHETPDPRTLMIPAGTPVARTQEGKSDDGTESWSYETKQEGAAWCGYYSSAAGDEGGWGFCFDGTGLSKATYFQAGATSVDTTFTRK